MSSVTMKGSLKIELEGRGLVTIRPSDHIATGGEGALYRLGKDLVVKIYTDPQRMLRLGLHDKIRLLSRFRSPYVVAPTGLVLSERHDPIGFYMPFADGHPLSRVFTNDFWKREGFTEKHARELVARMKETVSFAHDNGAIMVDANELNWLAVFTGANTEPRVVDVDSWTVGRWPSTAIMPSIRDWHASEFNAKSDWFAWGVVTFQVFTGLHPYKGTHPSYKRSEFVERMKANASVFAPHVRLNQAVRDFSLIPKPLLGWYEAVFEKGERSQPPSPLDSAQSLPSPALTKRVISRGKSESLIYEKLYERTNDPVVRVFRSGAVQLASGLVIDPRTKQEITQAVKECEVSKTPDGWLVLERISGKLVLTYSEPGTGTRETLPFSVDAKSILGYENRLFSLGERGLTEIKIHSFGKKAVASAGETWSALLYSTNIFDGLAIQDAMGAKFAVIPTGAAGLVNIRIKELDGLRIVSGKAGKQFASVIGVDKLGQYQRVDLVFTKDHSAYQSEISAVDQPELNMAVLPKGVVASITDDGELVIKVPSNGTVSKIEDQYISTDMTLGSFGDQVVYIREGTLWSVKMR